MWPVTHVTRDMSHAWREVIIMSKRHVPSVYGWGVMLFFMMFEQKDNLFNHLSEIEFLSLVKI